MGSPGCAGDREAALVGAEAVELGAHVSWLSRYEGFAELKRDRMSPPALESVRQWEEDDRVA